MKRYIAGILLIVTGAVSAKAQQGVGLQTDNTDSLAVSFIRTANDVFEKPQIVPISPEAASLGIYGAIPIGHYTGTANISVPIYEIDLDGKKFPVNISYHPSGIKVSQEASNIGLGWSLQAGGIIVKDVRGWDDFDDRTKGYVQGYYFDNETPQSDGDNNPISEDIADKYKKYNPYRPRFNQKDSEPDIFHYSFSGQSGRMSFNKVNTGSNTKTKAYPIIQNITTYLSIEYDIYNDQWKIIDGDGYSYYFNTKETTSFFSHIAPTSFLNPSTLVKDPLYFQSRYPEPEVVTAWYLDSIVSPKHNTLMFDYQKEGVSTLINMSESIYHLLDYRTSFYHPIVYSPNYSTPFYSYSYSEIDQARIQKIRTQNIAIEFKSEKRVDLEEAQRIEQRVNKPQKISEILISNSNSDLLKRFKLGQTYFGNTSSFKTCRLRLDNIIEYSAKNDAQGQKHNFIYSDVDLPEKYSNMHDDWGYYNGRKSSSNRFSETIDLNQNFTTHIPELKHLDQYGREKYFKGRNRTVVDEYIQSGSLTQIQYPTGGIARLNYEPHILGYTDINTVETERTILAKVHTRNYEPNPEDYSEDAPPASPVYEQDFTIEQDIDTHFSYWFYVVNKKEGYDDTQVFGCIRLRQGDNIIKSFSFGNGNGYGHHEVNIKNLKAGKYTLEIIKDCIYSPHDYWLSSLISHDTVKNDQYKNKAKGGGLRMKSIDFLENDQIVKKTTYTYSDGRLMSRPEFHNRSKVMFTQTAWFSVIEDREPTENHIQIYCDFLISRSNPFTPFSTSATGASVGYSWVTETTQQVNKGNELEVLRKDKYFYNNIADEIDNNFPYSEDKILEGLRGKPFLGNGLLLKKETYNNKVDLKSSTEYEYEEDSEKCSVIKGFVIYRNPLVLEDQLGDNSHLINIKFYDIPSSYWFLKSETTDLYAGDDTFAGSSTKKYSYNKINLLPSSIISENSKSQKTESKINFAFESSDIVASKIRDRNMVSTVSEQISLIDDMVIGGNKIKYSEYHGNMILPSEFSILNINTPIVENEVSNFYKKNFTITQYDTKGNILQYTTFDDISTCYLWSYKGQYPVAEIKNATYEEVTNALTGTTPEAISALSEPDMTKINALRNTLPHALVTTYTYKPLVGMTSMTDPAGVKTIYTYDDFGRLKETLIEEGGKQNPVNTYQYHYRTSSEP